MKREYLQPFLKAAEEIAGTYFGLPITKTDYDLEKTLALDKDVIIALGIKGDLSGIVLIGIDRLEAVKLASQALNKMGMEGEFKEWNELTESTIKEFGNQMVGFAADLYDRNNLKCDITTPTFISKEQLEGYKKESIRFEMKNSLAAMTVKLHINKS
jgi:CheY-specific phosphatase CheX